MQLSRCPSVRSIVTLLGFACLGALASAGDVLRVGPGQTFAQIGPAVASAASGDLILVTPGTYAPFVVAGKGLAIAGDGGTFVVNQTPGVAEIVVRNVPLGQDVTILSAQIDFLDAGAPAVRVEDNAGSVRFSGLVVAPTDHLLQGTTAQAMVEVERTALFWLIDSLVWWEGVDGSGNPLDFVAHSLRPRIGNSGVSALQLVDSHGIVQNSRLRGLRSLQLQDFGGDGLRLVDQGPDLTDASAWLLEDRVQPGFNASFRGGNGFNGGHAVHQIRDPIERNLIRACGGRDDAVTLIYGPGAGMNGLGGKIGGLYGENNSNGGRPSTPRGGGVAFFPPEHCPDAWRNESSVLASLVPIGSSFDVRVRSRLPRNYVVVFTGSARFAFAPAPFSGRAVLDPGKVLGWRGGTTAAMTTQVVSMPIPLHPALFGRQITVQTAFGEIGSNLTNLGQPALAVLTP